jgi:hypothetical protein
MKMKFEIKNRYSGEVQIEADIDCPDNTYYSIKLRLSVKWAIKNKKALQYADLSGAELCNADLIGVDLRYADLSDAELSGANLSGANLRNADLSGADLCNAELSGANLRNADLSGAELSGANLRYADLSGAELSGADLSGANLRYADLSGADLSGADLSYKDLRVFKHDFWGILLQFKNEIPDLIKAIKEGKIDGSVYEGDCCCLMGTIAKIKKEDIEEDNFDIKDASSPIERWFTMIKPKMTPDNSFASKKALEWIEEFLELSK